jgi:hypothetical protein
MEMLQEGLLELEEQKEELVVQTKERRSSASAWSVHYCRLRGRGH